MMSKKLLLSVLLVVTVLMSTLCFTAFAADNEMTLVEFQQAIVEGQGTFDGTVGGTYDKTVVKFTNDTDDATYVEGHNTNNSYTRQYFGLFGKTASSGKYGWDACFAYDVNVNDVEFIFTADADQVITTAEFQFYTVGNITLTDCTFDSVALSPWGHNSSTTGRTISEKVTVSGCTFKNIQNRGSIHYARMDNITVDGCTFTNCERGIHISSQPVSSITFTDNIVDDDEDMLYLICLGSDTGTDFSNTTYTITGNTSNGNAPVVAAWSNTVDNAEVATAVADESNNFADAPVFDASVRIATLASTGTKYSLAGALKNANPDGDTITLDAGTYELGEVVLPNTIKNLTIVGAADHATVLKNSKLTTPALPGTLQTDGTNVIDYDGLTVDGIVFDNSNILIKGWANSALNQSVSFANMEFTNNIFKNIENDTNQAAIHLQNAGTEPVVNFTATGNVIDGLVGGLKSGIYGAVDGNVTISGNTISNVSFNGATLELAGGNGTDDTVNITGNTISGAANNALQVLNNAPEGTDTVALNVKENIFEEIGGNYMIRSLSMNKDVTTVDFSENYYDVDITENPSMIVYNTAAGAADLFDYNVFPTYTALTADGEIDTTSADYGESVAVATDGINFYGNLQAAIDAAGENAVVTVLADASYEIDTQSLTAKLGDDDAAVIISKDKKITLDLNGYTIKVVAEVADGEKFTQSGAVMNHGDLTVTDNSASADGKIVFEYVGAYDGGNYRHGAIMNMGTLTVNGGTVENVTALQNQPAIDNTNYNGTDAVVVINNGAVKSVGYYAIDMVGYYDFIPARINSVTVNDGLIEGGIYSRVQANTNLTLTVNGGTITSDFAEAVRYRVYYADMGNTYTASITGGTLKAADGYKAVDVQLVDGTTLPGFISGGDYSSDVSAYLAEGYDLVYSAAINTYRVMTDAAAPSDQLKLVLKETETQGVYDIILENTQAEDINEFVSAEITFNNTSRNLDDTADLTYTVVGNDKVNATPALNMAVSPIASNENVWAFSVKESVEQISEVSIPLGQVKFDGYGTVNLAVDKAVVYTTLTLTNNEDVYSTEDDTLIVDTTDTTNAAIAEDTRNVVVKIDFVHNLAEGNDAFYNDMKVTLEGENGVVYTGKVGSKSDLEQEVADEYAADYTAKQAEITFEVPVGYRYTVTIEGAGYRTARYTTVVDDVESDLVLNFWNNLKYDAADSLDPKKEIEVGVSGYSDKNFLAGDIVMDNYIDKYDLAAVVSYFGTFGLDANTKPQYAKYDLNRDGDIDSQDIAYVLYSIHN